MDPGSPSPFACGESPDQLLGLIHWLNAASRQLRRKLAEVAAGWGISDSELLVIWLCRGGGHVQVDLAAAIGVSPAQMSGLVERLGQRGLVAMNRPVRDRRRQVWKTAALGEALLSEAAAPLASLAAALSGQVSAADQALVHALCQQLTSAAAQHAQHDEQRSGKEAA